MKKSISVLVGTILFLTFMGTQVFAASAPPNQPDPEIEFTAVLINHTTNEIIEVPASEIIVEYETNGVEQGIGAFSMQNDRQAPSGVANISVGLVFDPVDSDANPVVFAASSQSRSNSGSDGSYSCTATAVINYTYDEINTYRSYRLDSASASWSLYDSSVRCTNKRLEYGQYGKNPIGIGVVSNKNTISVAGWSRTATTGFTRYVVIGDGVGVVSSHAICTLQRGTTSWSLVVSAVVQ